MSGHFPLTILIYKAFPPTELLLTQCFCVLQHSVLTEAKFFSLDPRSDVSKILKPAR